MVGTPQLLTPDDPSPFYELAPIPPGEMQFAVDTPCFRWEWNLWWDKKHRHTLARDALYSRP